MQPSLVQKAVDLLLDLCILPIRSFIRIAKYEDDFVPVILKSVLEHRWDIGCTFCIHRSELVGTLPNSQLQQTIEIRFILISFANHTNLVLLIENW